jgi:hypothetical protein
VKKDKFLYDSLKKASIFRHQILISIEKINPKVSGQTIKKKVKKSLNVCKDKEVSILSLSWYT